SAVVPRLRPHHDAAFAPKGIAYFTDSRAPGSLLLPGFLATAGDLRASFRFMSAGAEARSILLDGEVHQAFVDRACEHRVCEVEVAHDFVVKIFDLYFCHVYRPDFSTTRYPPGGPGTAPRKNKRLFS